MQSVLVLNHAKVCRPAVCRPADAHSPRTERQSVPNTPEASRPTPWPGWPPWARITQEESSSGGVPCEAETQDIGKGCGLRGWDGQAQSTALEFKSQTPKTASSVGLSLLTLQVPASTPSSPPASALKRQMLNWTALCARHCSKRGAVLSPHQLVVLLSPNCHPGRVPGGQC